MPWFPCPCQAAGGVLALEAFRFVRACFRIQRSSLGRAPVGSHDALSVFEAVDVDTRACGWGGGVESGTSICVRVLSPGASVRVLLLIPSTGQDKELF